MFLLIGLPGDPWCAALHAALDARGRVSRLVPNPLADPTRFAWRLDTERSASQLAWDGEPPLADRDVEGVLVRGPAWIDPTGWAPDEMAYVFTETQSALLGWLWSLPCPVVNRYPAELWLRPQIPLVMWQTPLRRNGVPVLDMVVSNVDAATRAFGERVGGALVYTPLSAQGVAFLVHDDESRAGLAEMQRWAPVCLGRPHGAPLFACVVGTRVVWSAPPSDEAAALEPALARFAAAIGLAFVEVVLAPTADGLRAIAVEPFARFEHFGDAARAEIADALAGVLVSAVPTPVAARHVPTRAHGGVA